MIAAMPKSLKSQAEINSEASLWLAKRRMQAPDEFDQAGFDKWLEADARHQAAYALASRAATAAAASLKRTETVEEIVAPRRAPWRMAATGIAVAAATAAAFFFAAPMFRGPQAIHATEIAQIEQVALADGSVVTLGPASHIEIAFSERERRVALTSGEAFFEVAHDASRPFFVEAGDAIVRVIGTKFDVHRGGDLVRVSVAEGVVQVRAAALPVAINAAQPVVLRAGDIAELAERIPIFGAQDTASVATTTPANAGAWRQGRLVYVEAPLSVLVADLNRYYRPGVRLADSGLGAYRLTASFKADEIDTFFSTLPAAAPVSVARGADGKVTIAAAN